MNNRWNRVIYKWWSPIYVIKKSFSVSAFNPQPWLRGESILLMIVFYITGVMGTLSPPHDVEFTVKSVGASKWVEMLLGKNILTTIPIRLDPSIQSILLMLVSILFLLMIFISFKRTRPILAIMFGVGFSIALYSGLMLSVIV